MPRTSVQQLADEIRIKIKRDPGRRIHRATKDFAEQVRDYIKYQTAPAPWNTRTETVVGHGRDWPYATGAFAESVQIKRGKGLRGISSWTVYSDSPIAHFLEYGTAPDRPGTHSPWGPNTPTAEYAPFGKAAHHFGGTMG